ncbi:1,4-dihydroxy-2-naphthoate octaprenyltransferase [Cohaesibacter celericrescens]|nr:1,4-dihydroxy-2-naphthoate octaprenyltransferase [Cohaesibacter celericrescens]
MSVQRQITRDGLGVWLMAIRPKTLILSLAPVLLAGILAFKSMAAVNWEVFPFILLSAGLIQIATNLWNDAADAGSGLDIASERLGPPRVTSLGLLQAGTVKSAAYLCLAVAALCGLYLAFIGGWPILLIGVVGILFAFGYSTGPYPISGSPLGEVFVILFFGIMSVMGSNYLLTDSWSMTSLWAGFYVGLPAAAVLTVNNHRDREGDTKGGRRTLAIQLGPRRTKQLYTIFLLVSCIGIVHVSNVISFGTLSLVSVLASAVLMAFALSVPIRNLFLANTAADLNKCLMGTSMFQLVWIAAFIFVQLLT